MDAEFDIVVHLRKDRDIKKKIITPGDYNVVPYDDAKCRVIISDITSTNNTEATEDSEHYSTYLSPDFNGLLTIGDCDNYLDNDIDLILQQMCKGEVCLARLVYRDNVGSDMKEVTCRIELLETTEEELISDWDWMRLYNTAVHHKDRGVELVKKKRIADGFRRFSKALKLLVAVEPVDPQSIPEEKVAEMIDLKVKLYNNLAHCQLYYKEYSAALELCNKALCYDPDNVKAAYRRCTAYMGLTMYEEAWSDIQLALRIDPHDKAAQQKEKFLKDKIEKINKDYTSVIKKMFG